MDRSEFESIRDIPNKRIVGELKLYRRGAVLESLELKIENELNVDLRLNVTLNPEAGGKKFNVHIPGIGPICRLEVDGLQHGEAGRSHKHALKKPECPRRNLHEDVTPRPELAGKELQEVFVEFCRLANIECEGEFEIPAGND
jgi:hypothetical protein